MVLFGAPAFLHEQSAIPSQIDQYRAPCRAFPCCYNAIRINDAVNSNVPEWKQAMMHRKRFPSATRNNWRIFKVLSLLLLLFSSHGFEAAAQNKVLKDLLDPNTGIIQIDPNNNQIIINPVKCNPPFVRVNNLCVCPAGQKKLAIPVSPSRFKFFARPHLYPMPTRPNACARWDKKGRQHLSADSGSDSVPGAICTQRQPDQMCLPRRPPESRQYVCADCKQSEMQVAIRIFQKPKCLCMRQGLPIERSRFKMPSHRKTGIDTQINNRRNPAVLEQTWL